MSIKKVAGEVDRGLGAGGWSCVDLAVAGGQSGEVS